MSAYVVDDKTINNIVAYLKNSMASWRTDWVPRAFEDAYDVESAADFEQLATDLFNMNVEAVEQRYGKGEASEFRPLDFQYRIEIPLPAKLVYSDFRCLLYQCNEGNVPDTGLYQMLQDAFNRLAHKIVQDELDR